MPTSFFPSSLPINIIETFTHLYIFSFFYYTAQLNVYSAHPLTSMTTNPHPRKSAMQLGEVYFWTSTIHQWKPLLRSDKYKQIVMESLSTLCQRAKIKVYGFVIMPNHVHLLWEMLEPNGREMPYASFQKYTAHAWQADLRRHYAPVLASFFVGEKERAYRFWQRDALAIKISSRWVAEQKLRYIHDNPLQAHWNLAQAPEDYLYSSAAYYEKDTLTPPFLTHYSERFG